jgi:hypothetical protein
MGAMVKPGAFKLRILTDFNLCSPATARGESTRLPPRPPPPFSTPPDSLGLPESSSSMLSPKDSANARATRPPRRCTVHSASPISNPVGTTAPNPEPHSVLSPTRRASALPVQPSAASSRTHAYMLPALVQLLTLKSPKQFSTTRVSCGTFTEAKRNSSSSPPSPPSPTSFRPRRRTTAPGASGRRSQGSASASSPPPPPTTCAVLPTRRATTSSAPAAAAADRRRRRLMRRRGHETTRILSTV